MYATQEKAVEAKGACVFFTIYTSSPTVISSKLVSLDCGLVSNQCLICIMRCREHMLLHLTKLNVRELYALGP